ncbi:MAG TPA: aspartate aminotransferase family protein [Rhodospirillaceae bacterium]|nr:aspartate aminotransferase family protein [Rhodospirillaceae bacterium]
MNRSFEKSNKMLGRALEIIPTASQTFSKSHLQYPKGHAPMFIERGLGSRVWDVDGNEYIDMVNGLMAVSLGYNDPDVNRAVMEQLSKGICFSLPSELEYELAQLLVEIIPCAEMVRFGKNGSDATSAAIRLSRAYTGRDKVAVCGYHGWQDWYIGSTARHLGVPQPVRALTQTVPYNDLEALENILKTETYAAFILEPMNVELPRPGYLEGIRKLTESTGTVLVFDEIVTGFHYALGGAQEYFGVTPDLSSFGKGMGNGMPIGAIVGKKEIMKLQDDIFFSGTFGGEALSLAASIAAIKKMKREPVIKQLWSFGGRLSAAVEKVIAANGLGDVLSLKGLDPWKVLSFSGRGDVSAMAVRTFIQKEMIAQGVLLLSSHNMSYAFTEGDHVAVVSAYEKTLDALASGLKRGTLVAEMGCPVIEPIFKVR